MKDIKYQYCFDEHDNLVFIGKLNQKNRYDHSYKCLQCGKEMEANIGSKNRAYFSHKSNTACDGESYLHKLAKIRIKNKFDTSDNFPIVFKRGIPCSEVGNCIVGNEIVCKTRNEEIPLDLKKWKGKPLYDICQEEEPYGGFQPDLLLSSKSNPDRPPIFIEVYKTHKSSDSKMNSGYRIIETFKLSSEADIDDFINRGFIENENCKIIGFNPETKKAKKIEIEIAAVRVIINKNGLGRFLRVVKCGMVNKKIDPNSVLELNVLPMALIQNVAPQMDPNPIQIGLAYALKRGIPIRNCMLCNFYKFNEWHSKYICIKYKKLGLEDSHPEQKKAITCNDYIPSQAIERYTLLDLQKVVSEINDDLIEVK